jgi:hypothetical protein
MDYREKQDKGTKFHYVFPLILIALMAWMELEDTQFLGVVKNPCFVARYVNLWNSVHKEIHLHNIISFYVYK